MHNLCMDKVLAEMEKLEREIERLIEDIELYDDVGHPKITVYKQQLYEKRAKLAELELAINRLS